VGEVGHQNKDFLRLQQSLCSCTPCFWPSGENFYDEIRTKQPKEDSVNGGVSAGATSPILDKKVTASLVSLIDISPPILSFS
jgi:hypothetical protein